MLINNKISFLKKNDILFYCFHHNIMSKKEINQIIKMHDIPLLNSNNDSNSSKYDISGMFDEVDIDLFTLWDIMVTLLWCTHLIIHTTHTDAFCREDRICSLFIILKYWN